MIGRRPSNELLRIPVFWRNVVDIAGVDKMSDESSFRVLEWGWDGGSLRLQLVVDLNSVAIGRPIPICS